MMRKIAIYGGAFDPPHIAHLNLIHHLRSLKQIDQVWLLPCGDRNDKKLLLSMQSRFKLMRAIFKQFPKIHICQEQIKLSKSLKKAIHTYDLLNELKQRYKDSKFYFVCGADILHTIHLWGNWQKLLEQNAFIFFYRKGIQFKHQRLPKDNIVIQIDLPQISSTQIKKIINSNIEKQQKIKQLKNWITDEVTHLLIEQQII